jgi:Rieske Fe-S protein
MKTRSVAWRWLLMIVGVCMAGLFAVSVLGVPYPQDSVITIDTRGLPAVSRQQIPRGMRAIGSGGKAQTPTAIWLVQQEHGWLALSDGSPHPRGCPVAWQPQQQVFMDPCLGQVFNRNGLNIAGPAPRGLDAFPVTVESATLISVDVARAQPVSHQ